MSHRAQFLILRIFLFFSAAVWGVSIVGIVLPWSRAVLLLERLGMEAEVNYDPMLDYWLRMITGAFGLLGLLFLALALYPRRFRTVLPLFGWLMLIEGMVLLVHGVRLQLPALPFLGDAGSCLLGGAGILWFRRAANAPVNPGDNAKV